MKIEDLISGKDQQENVHIDGVSIPVKRLKRFLNEGYENVKVYTDNRTISLWGKNCTACFTEEQLACVD